MIRPIANVTLACGIGAFARASTSSPHGLFVRAVATELDHPGQKSDLACRRWL
jgi:hypothetical protein